MFTKTLSKKTKRALALLGDSHLLDFADLRDIAAMKIDAIASRGVKRDFVDLYFLCKNGFSLKEVLGFYSQKYKVPTSHFLHIQKNLVYFTDADVNTMPKMLKVADWKTIKKFFETEVKKLP